MKAGENAQKSDVMTQRSELVDADRSLVLDFSQRSFSPVHMEDPLYQTTTASQILLHPVTSQHVVLFAAII